MRVDCNATDHGTFAGKPVTHRCCLEPGHEGRHLCADCRHAWTNPGPVITADGVAS